MILYDKLKEKYSKEELKSILGEAMGRRVWRGESKINIFTLSRKIKVSQLNYSFEHFINDFEHLYSKHKEKLFLYKLFLKGISPMDLCKRYNIENRIYTLLLHGFDYNSTSRNLHFIFDYLDIDIDTSHFVIDCYPTHIELFGKKKDLEKFKTQFNIKYDLYYEPYKKSWHLAFNGCLAMHIKYKKDLI